MKIRPSCSVKNESCKLVAGFAVLMLGLAVGAQTHYAAQPGGASVKIDGTSTAHDWEMEGRIISGLLELPAGVSWDASQTSITGLQGNSLHATVHARIPITCMHSKAEHMPEVMDRLTQEHLKADQFPRIEYVLKEMTFKGPHAPGKPFEFDTKGDLAIAGKTNQVSFPVTIELQDAGKIKIDATVPLKMTAFGVDPPAPNIGLGLMRCGDDVKIIISWTLVKR
jgi:polyisoprenoid-binding protein YceI